MRNAIEDTCAGRRRSSGAAAGQRLSCRGAAALVTQSVRHWRAPARGLGLEIEITRAWPGNLTQLATSAIRALGVTVALDDFGTGFSSLTQLARLPIDTLKIDRAFIEGMDATPEGLALVSMIITLARSLRHKVVAEGVETAEQARLLRSLDCDEMQGFHFAQPVPAGAFEASYLAPTDPEPPLPAVRPA